MKKIEKIISVILYVTIIFACLIFCGMYIVSLFVADDVEIVEHEYGNTPGNYINGHAAQGEQGLYFTLADEDREISDIYMAENTNTVRKLDIQGYDLSCYNGYLYFVDKEGYSCLVKKMDESSGEIETLFSADELNYDAFKFYELELDSFVDGKLVFRVLGVKSGLRKRQVYAYVEIDSNDNVKILSQYTRMGVKQFSDFLISIPRVYQKQHSTTGDVFYEWEPTFYNSEDIKVSHRQIYNGNIYMFERGKDEEALLIESHMLAPRKLYVLPVVCLFYPEEFVEKRILIDENVMAFNLTFDELYYTKKEENGEIRVLKCDLDGSNKTEIAVFDVEKDQWALSMCVGNGVIIVKIDNSGARAGYTTYIISTDGTSVYELKDVIQ